MKKVSNYYTSNFSMQLCILLEFTLKILIHKIYSFSGMEGLKPTIYIRDCWKNEIVIKSNSGVQIFETTTLILYAQLSYRIRSTFAYTYKFIENPTSNNSDFITYSNKIYFSGLWLDNCGYLINKWKHFWENILNIGSKNW